MSNSQLSNKKIEITYFISISKMPTCNICLENTQTRFQPAHRHPTCKCSYTVHESCYNTWLSQSNMAYNCIICHKTVREVPPANYVEGLDYLVMGKRIALVILVLFILKYIREIILIGGIILYTYISIEARRNGRNMFYHYTMNFLFGRPIPDYRYPHVHLVRQLVRFWR